jgi:hypothetical protein
MGISDADLVALDAIGWGSAWSYLDQLQPTYMVFAGYSEAAVPEPTAFALLATGLLALGCVTQRNRSMRGSRNTASSPANAAANSAFIAAIDSGRKGMR